MRTTTRTSHRAPRLLALILATAALALACASTTVNVNAYDDAVATFSRTLYCPIDRITVHANAAAVPSEIAADPQRLALFQASHADKAYFLIEGCGKSTAYVCRADARRRSSCMADLEGELTALRARIAADRATPAQATPAPDDAKLEKTWADFKADLAADEEVKAITRTLPPGKYPMGFSLQRDPRGLRVAVVVPGGQADGKLRIGDVIVAAEGVQVATFAQLWPILKAHLGGPVTLTVGRGGTQIQVVVKLGG